MVEVVVVMVVVVMLLLLCKLVAVDDMVVPSGRPSLNRDHHQSVPTNSRTFAALMNQRQFQTCLLPLFALNLHPLIIQRRFRRNSFRTFVANILHNIF